MNSTDQVEITEELITEAERQGIELNLSDLDLVGGGIAGNILCNCAWLIPGNAKQRPAMRGVSFQIQRCLRLTQSPSCCCSILAGHYAATNHAQALGGQLNYSWLLDYFFLCFDNNFHDSLRAKAFQAPNWTKSLRFLGLNRVNRTCSLFY